MQIHIERLGKSVTIITSHFNFTDPNTAQGIIYVFASCNKERFPSMRDTLHRMMDDHSKDTVLLVLANKQDLDGAMNVSEVTETLKLNDLNHVWHIQLTCATKDEGVVEGLDWLTMKLKQTSKNLI